MLNAPRTRLHDHKMSSHSKHAQPVMQFRVRVESCRCCSPPVHVHGAATEFLTVREGELGYLANGTEHTVKASDGSVRIEPGVPHTYWNMVRAAQPEIRSQSTVLSPSAAPAGAILLSFLV
jgi:Cupin domain